MLKENLQSYLFYIFAESVVEVSNRKAKQFAIEAANDGLFSIPNDVNWRVEITLARQAAENWKALKS